MAPRFNHKNPDKQQAGTPLQTGSGMRRTFPLRRTGYVIFSLILRFGVAYAFVKMLTCIGVVCLASELKRDGANLAVGVRFRGPGDPGIKDFLASRAREVGQCRQEIAALREQ
jgi:hypothetical protein